jgi:hypothetical protein
MGSKTTQQNLKQNKWKKVNVCPSHTGQGMADRFTAQTQGQTTPQKHFKNQR